MRTIPRALLLLCLLLSAGAAAAQDGAGPRISALQVPMEGSGEPVVVEIRSDLDAGASVMVLVNNVQMAIQETYVAAGGSERLRFFIEGLRAGSTVEARVGNSSASSTVGGPTAPTVTWSPAPPVAEPIPATVAYATPEPINTEEFSFWIEPGEVHLPRGGRAVVNVYFRNDDANYSTGSEPPIVLNLPEGVHWWTPPADWREVRAGELVQYELIVYADEDAPHSITAIGVQGRRQLDRPTFRSEFLLYVEEPTQTSAMPPVGYLVAAGVAGVVAAGVAFRDWLRWLSALAIAPMYTRISKAQVLGNDVRKGIYDHVVAHPGERLADIAKALDLSVTPTLFHLRVLEREGYVASRREWSRTLYYATERAPAFPREGRDVASTLTRLLADNPGMPPAEVAQRLGISRQLARYHLLALEKQGVLARAAKGYVVVIRQ